VMTMVAQCNNRSSTLAAVVCSGRNRPHVKCRPRLNPEQLLRNHVLTFRPEPTMKSRLTTRALHSAVATARRRGRLHRSLRSRISVQVKEIRSRATPL
jgi:hypothetical protein